MTLFAGVFSTSPGRQIPAELKRALFANLSRANGAAGTRLSHDVPRMYLAKWDSEVFAEPAWHVEPDGSVCTLAGDPLLVEDEHRITRTRQLEFLSAASRTERDELFEECRGSFAFLRYRAQKQELCLATDAIGLRTIYYTLQEGLLIFATAIRILEAIPSVTKTLSASGMAELSVFSFPLADRTPYIEVQVLRESQVLTASASGIKLRNYHDWAAPVEASQTPQDAAMQLHAQFRDAIRLRSGHDRRVYSFLSGGMDSRAIVATLINLGCHVEALNFSADDSQDQCYAQLFAREAGDSCRLHCLKGGAFPNFSFLAMDAKTALEHREATNVDRPQLIWSGDGGSVGLGHVYMDERMLDFGESGDTDAAIRYFLEFNRINLPRGVLSKQARRQLPELLHRNVRSEVDRYPVPDFGRRIYLFLLFNDQRRHLFKHFETIDQHGLELLTPFYDARLLKAIAATPSRWGILHRLYARFFEHLPAFALQSPWQTYPGHMPCPLPSDQRASYQWSRSMNSKKDNWWKRVLSSKRMLRALKYDTQPSTFSGSRIRAAALLHAVGARDYWHLEKMLQIYQHHQIISRTSNSNY